ncbi:MAG: FdhF/YdeP family oxidoreductase [Planctomycetes bacterium]|nr:FdhF/YdeP family oxidoreductase [Planctomycetota bacterium]
MGSVKAGGGWPAIFYVFRKAREAGGMWRLHKALRARNACKACALGMGGQLGGMVNERGHRLEVCKKSIQAMAADMQGRVQGHFFDDFSIEKMRGFSPRELETAGRLVEPMYKGPLDTHYRPIAWAEAIDRVAAKLRKTTPDESFFYFSGRSSNEAGFLLQLFARLHGTNNVNNCSFYCHQASGVGLSSVTGSGTATVLLEDVERCDLLVLIGANPSSNHPRLMKTIVELRRRGGKVIVINPLREVGLERFRVPSDVRSMLFGSRTSDAYVQPHIGGDIALLSGIARAVLDRDAVDESFVERSADDWARTRDHLAALDWDEIVRLSGVRRDEIERLADMYIASERTIFCWAMGITHHEHGVENVQAIANLAMMRGQLGRRGCGLLPLRGHSNVQGIGSVGVTPKLKDAIFERLEETFDVKLPTSAGLDTLDCIVRAHEQRMRFALCLGGNLYGSNPDSTFAAEAMNRLDTVVYLSTTLNTGHAWGTGRETIILPVLARDEEPEATTQESMFNYVRFSEGGRPRHEGPRSEVEVIASIAEAYFAGDGDTAADSPIDWASMRRHRRIREAIAKIIPGYAAIGEIDETKREFQIDGRTFHEPSFPTASGRARFHAVALPELRGGGDGELRLMTVRSEGQFNTVVYEEEDVYRGQERRDVIMMSDADRARLGLEIDQLVRVVSEAGALANVRVRLIDVAPGNAVMYFPEANVLVLKTADARSKTPSFKNTVVRVEA